MIDWSAISKALDAMDVDANPVGTTRNAAMTPRVEGGLISIAGLPGTWEVMSCTHENGIWMHEIVRVL